MDHGCLRHIPPVHQVKAQRTKRKNYLHKFVLETLNTSFEKTKTLPGRTLLPYPKSVEVYCNVSHFAVN